MRPSLISLRTLAPALLALALALPGTALAEEVGEMFDEAELLVTGTLEDMVMGEDDAPVTIVEYASMTCPHCAAFHAEVLPKLKETYIDTGKVRLIFREFPLDRLAATASMAARCIDKSRYFPFISVLFAQQSAWVRQGPIDPLKNLAKQAGLSDEGFDKCQSNQELLDGIIWVLDRAKTEFTVGGTPTFFVDGEIVHAEIAQDFAKLSAVIDRHLAE